MTTNFHTAIATNAGANAATFNSPLGQLDSALTDLIAGDDGITGLQLSTATAKTLNVSGVLTADQIIHTVTSNTGTSDTLSSISGLNSGEILFLKATATHTITISNGTIKCISGSDETMTADTLFMFANVGGTYYCLDSVGTVPDAASITYTPLDANDWDGNTDPGNTDDALDQLAAARTAIAILRDEKTTGTDGGGASATTWNARDLNTEVYDNQNIVTISANQFTPIAGEYLLKASAPGVEVVNHRLRLYNVTGAAVVDEGQNTRTPNTADGDTSMAHLKTVFTANGTDAYRIDHYTQTAQATNGLGSAVSDGSNEVYLEILLQKIG